MHILDMCLLHMQDAQAQQTFVLEQVRKQAVDLGQATVAMPARVEQMSTTLSGLEGGEIKLRVRALEVERAARRASIMQVNPSHLPCLTFCLIIFTALVHCVCCTDTVSKVNVVTKLCIKPAVNVCQCMTLSLLRIDVA